MSTDVAGMTHVRWIIVLLACWQGSAAYSQIHAVGFRLLETQDHSRIVTGGSESGDTHPRPIRTYLWYPARTSENAVPMNFGRYAELADDDIWPIVILGGLHDKLGYSQRPLARSLGPERFEELKRKPVAAFEDATPFDGPFPLIAIAQGLYYESPVVFAALAEYLAGHGFVIVTCPLVGTNSPIVTMDVPGLETQVRDLEFSIGVARGLPFVSKKELGVFGFDMGGAAGLILSMRNADVDAFVSVSSGILYPNPSSIPAASPDYDPAALRIPWLHSVPSGWIRDSDSTDDKSLFDLARHSNRYLLLTEDMGHVDYTSYALIEDRPAMIEYWEAAKPGDVDRYTTVVDYVAKFYVAFLKNDSDAWESLSTATTLSLERREAEPPAITYEGFVQAVVAGGGREAVEELRDLRELQPDHKLLNETYLNRLVYSLRGTWRLDEEILPLLKFTAELYPESEDAVYSLAEGHITLGDYKAAIENYEQLLLLDPNDRHNYIRSRLAWLRSQ